MKHVACAVLVATLLAGCGSDDSSPGDAGGSGGAAGGGGGSGATAPETCGDLLCGPTETCASCAVDCCETLSSRLSPTSLPDALVGVGYDETLRVSGPAASDYEWAAEPAPPAGLSLQSDGSATARLTGVPTEAASVTLVVSARLPDGASAARAYRLAVLVPSHVLYVDGSLGADCTSYEPGTRSCTAGSATAFRTLAGAANAAVAGDAVLVRAGTYEEQLVPLASGAGNAPIHYRGYPGEEASITGAALEPAIDLSDRTDVHVEHLGVDGVQRWLLALRSERVIVRQVEFANALDEGGSSKTGLFFQDGTNNRVLDCTITGSTQDNVSFVHTDSNVLAGNHIESAAHTLWTIKCGNRNVVRENFFSNEREKIGEIFDCDAVGYDHEYTIADATKRNLVEDNDFAFTPSSGDSSPYAGIQYAGQQGIIRNNRFYRTVGPGLDLTQYGGEAEHTTDNRVYANVFYGTDFAGVAFAGGADWSGNVLKNNVLTGSVFVANDTRWSWYTGELAGKPVQLLTGTLEGFWCEGNDLVGQQPGEPYVVTYGHRDSDSNPEQHELSWWEANHPELFAANLEVAPELVDPDNADFHLADGSPLVDAGVALTYTLDAGSGTSLLVEDAAYFHDGLGIPDEPGDEIQLVGTDQVARVVAVDLTSNELQLGESLSWQAGQGVGLRYLGAGPDVGCYER